MRWNLFFSLHDGCVHHGKYWDQVGLCQEFQNKKKTKKTPRFGSRFCLQAAVAPPVVRLCAWLQLSSPTFRWGQNRPASTSLLAELSNCCCFAGRPPLRLVSAATAELPHASVATTLRAACHQGVSSYFLPRANHRRRFTSARAALLHESPSLGHLCASRTLP